jgi:hypothetical protein
MERENGLPTRRGEPRWHWQDSQEDLRVRFPKERPVEPEIGSGWHDEASGSFCVWDGRQWVCVPVD